MANKKLSKAGLKILSDLKDATDGSTGFTFLSKEQADAAGQGNDPTFVLTNAQMTDPTDPTKQAAKITDAGRAYLTQTASAPVAASEGAAQSPYAIIKGVVLPESKKRGGGSGAPTVYQFDVMEIGDVFFVPKSEKHKDPVKSLGSAVSAANHKNATKVGEEMREVTKRGPKNKAVLDENGKKVKEMKSMPVYKLNKKFTIRAAEAGKTYGSWTAPADGAIIARVPVE